MSVACAMDAYVRKTKIANKISTNWLFIEKHRGSYTYFITNLFV